MLLSTILLSLTLIPSTLSKVPLFGPCKVANNRLINSNKEFSSDCDRFGYCHTNGTCMPKRCRKDKYLLSSYTYPTNLSYFTNLTILTLSSIPDKRQFKPYDQPQSPLVLSNETETPSTNTTTLNPTNQNQNQNPISAPSPHAIPPSSSNPSLNLSSLFPPPLCTQGFFCPDEQSTCLPLRKPGGDCQFSRDDQCLEDPSIVNEQGVYAVSTTSGGGLPSVPTLASGSGRKKVNREWWEEPRRGVKCLQGICQYSNRTIGQECLRESTLYTQFTSTGSSTSFTVRRDNCIEGIGYCGPTNNTNSLAFTCQPLKELGEACYSNVECKSYNCPPIPYSQSHLSTCQPDPSLPNKIPKYIVPVTLVSTFFGGVVIIMALMYCNKNREGMRAEERKDYEREQRAFRCSIITLADSLAENQYQYPYQSPTLKQKHSIPTFPTSTPSSPLTKEQERRKANLILTQSFTGGDSFEYETNKAERLEKEKIRDREWKEMEREFT